MERRDLIIASAVGIVGATLLNLQWAKHFVFYILSFAVFGVLGYGLVSLFKNLKK